MQTLTLDEICKLYYNNIYHFCLQKLNGDPHRADDITSDVFYLLIQKWDSFYSYSPNGIRMWLFKVAKLKILELSKQPTFIPLDETIFSDDIFDFVDSESELKKYNYYINQIEKLLSSSEYKIFTDIAINHKKYCEIAKEIGMSEHALQLRWYRLRKKLKDILSVLEKQYNTI